MRAAQQTGGAYLKVERRRILKAIAALGRAGIFAEPAGATAYAGLITALDQGMVDADDPVLVHQHRHWTEGCQAAMQAVRPAPIIEPTLTALRKHLQETR